MSRKRTFLAGLIVTTLVISSFSGCQSSPPEPDQPNQAEIAQTNFAVYREVPVNVKPSVAPYQVASGLSNITNKNHFVFSKEAEDMLIKNGFMVLPSPTREFFSIYESNRYSLTPNFVTTDAMLHNYHLYFSYLLRTLEKGTLSGELVSLTTSMLENSKEQYNALQGTDWENAAKRNVAFFAVAAKLLDDNADIPSYVKQEVNEECQLIADRQETLFPSPVMNLGRDSSNLADPLREDYTQYIPRGHYTKSEELKTYFKTMMWYGRMTFRTAYDDETKSAALITLLLGEQENYDHWSSIYEPTNFFVGKSDDLGFYQYDALLKEVYGSMPSLMDLTGKGKEWEDFAGRIKKVNPPEINSIPIFDEEGQPDRENAIKGFRLMGQRFTLDASIFQRLIYREVQENNSQERRMLPNGLDLPAAMGSQEAYEILQDMGETDYANYPQNMKRLQKHIASLDTATRTQNLYWSWLHMISPLTEAKGKGYPSFMQNQAWTRKQLGTYLSSWAELKHDTVLYAKQNYAEMGGGGDEEDDRGYVEPNPEVYARMAALTRMTIEGLQSRNLLSEKTKESLTQLEALALKLKTISEKELMNQTLSDDEYELILSFGGQLEHFWSETLMGEGADDPVAAAADPAALISDVATDPNGKVLEVGTGYVSEIYVVVPVDGSLRIAKGAVYSYYEFSWPSTDRLTDEQWREMLENEQEPEPPTWTKVYIGPEGSLQW